MSGAKRIWVAAIVCTLGMGAITARAQLPNEAFSAWSHSGQFIIQAPRAGLSQALFPRLETNNAYVRLDPTLLPVSCERIKRQVWRELGALDPWQSKIVVRVHPVRSPDEVVTLTSEKFRDGWTYGLDIPNLVEKNRYVRGVVQVCLQELANRTATVRSAELPQWLVEGLTEQILSSSEEEVILQAPGQSPNGVRFSPTVFESKRLNPLESLHKKLTTDTVLSFEELSWPTPNAFFGATGERYRQSAQLFIRALVELENGRTKLRSMVERLSQYHNWQFALLDSYQAHFRRPLDVEKWWTLRALYFTSRELGQTWPVQESWEKLDAILNPAVQIYAATNDLPLHASVNLQTIVRDWERTEKSAALQRAAVSLAQLRLRVSPELVPLVHEYLETLARFLENQERWADKDLPQQAIEPTLRRLDQLDDQARVMREPGSSPANTGTQTVQARSRANPAVNSSTRPAERNDWNPQRMLVRRRGSPVTRTW